MQHVQFENHAWILILFDHDAEFLDGSFFTNLDIFVSTLTKFVWNFRSPPQPKSVSARACTSNMESSTPPNQLQKLKWHSTAPGRTIQAPWLVRWRTKISKRPLRGNVNMNPQNRSRNVTWRKLESSWVVQVPRFPDFMATYQVGS